MADPETTETAPTEAADENGESEALSPFLEDVKAPISDANPVGDSVTYDDDFQQLKTQINEIGSASGEANYEAIVELARRILTEKSKDLRAAGYLVIGEARLNGPSGMAEATRAVQLLIDEYWEDLYPAKRRMRGRGSALQFISDRLNDWFESTKFEQPDREALVTARDNLKAIQDFGLKEMGEHAPSLSGLLKRMEKAIDKLPAPEPEPEPEPESAESEDADEGETEASAPRPKASAPAEIESESDATTAVAKAAAYLREQDLTDPIPYRLLRAVQWGILRKEPPNEGGKTRIQPPREQRRNYLSGLLEQGEYETLVREGESSFQGETFHFWLDLQRLLASALEALGKPYEHAHTAVMTDTALLLKRLPGLATLTFSDGTPFASPITLDWLETQVQPMLDAGESSGGGSAGAGDGQMPATQQYEEARQRLSSGDLSEALSIMKDGASQDASGKESFYRRLYVATLCMKGGQPAVARPLLDELDAGIEQHALATWNPSLAIEVWTNRCQCYDALAQLAAPEEKDELFAQADAAFEKICRVDAAKAVSVAERRPR